MNPNAEKLVDALESGKYRQTDGFLCGFDGAVNSGEPTCFCWAGLACEIFRQETGQGEWFYRHPLVLTKGPVEYRTFVLENRVYKVTMPKEVLDFFGISEEMADSLIEENDMGATFIDLGAAMRTRPEIFTGEKSNAD